MLVCEKSQSPAYRIFARRGLAALMCTVAFLSHIDEGLADDQAGTTPSATQIPAENKTPPEQNRRFGDWEMVCKGGTKVSDDAVKSPSRTCRLQQAQAVNSGKDVVFLFNIARQGTQRVAIISTPLNVYLPSGLELSIDGAQPRNVVFETCNILGCHAGFTLNTQMINALRRGKNLEVSMKDTKATAIPLSVSLNGISAGLAALDGMAP